MDEALTPRLQRMTSMAAAWQALADSLASGSVARGAYEQAFPRQQALYRAVVDSSESFNEALVNETERRRQEIIALCGPRH